MTGWVSQLPYWVRPLDSCQETRESWALPLPGERSPRQHWVGPLVQNKAPWKEGGKGQLGKWNETGPLIEAMPQSPGTLAHSKGNYVSEHRTWWAVALLTNRRQPCSDKPCGAFVAHTAHSTAVSSTDLEGSSSTHTGTIFMGPAKEIGSTNLLQRQGPAHPLSC